LPRVGGALSARSRQYQGTAASMSNAAKLGRSGTISNEQSPVFIYPPGCSAAPGRVPRANPAPESGFTEGSAKRQRTRELADRAELTACTIGWSPTGLRTVVVERADLLARDLMVQEVILAQFVNIGGTSVVPRELHYPVPERADAIVGETNPRPYGESVLLRNCSVVGQSYCPHHAMRTDEGVVRCAESPHLPNATRLQLLEPRHADTDVRLGFDQDGTGTTLTLACRVELDHEQVIVASRMGRREVRVGHDDPARGLGERIT